MAATISRRSLLAGAAALASVVPSAFGGCAVLDGATIPAPPPEAPFPQPAPTFIFEEPNVLERPLWSDILTQPSELKSMSKFLTAAYQSLAEASSQCPVPLASLLQETWTHYLRCQGGIHDSWDFLPWHRGYLYFHERLLRRTICDSFRLPVWDWENLPDVPALYNQWPSSALTPKGPLRAATLGSTVDLCKVKGWLVTQAGNPQEFIGYPFPNPPAGPKAFDGPHLDVHNNMRGVLSGVANAGADPLFYSHHANVDRWWIVWDRNYGQNWQTVPAYHDWLNQQQHFIDHFAADPTKAVVSIPVSQLLDPSKLGYRYNVPPIKLPPFVSTPIPSAGPIVELPSPLLNTLRNGRVDSVFIHFIAAISTLPGGYYRVGVQRPVPLDGETPLVLGGFTVFSPDAHNHAGIRTSVTVDLCLSPALLPKLLTMTKLKFVCQNLNVGSPFVDLKLNNIEFRLPA